ncbi:MAG TPA: ATP-binding protein [Gemmatimonadales bacterium]|jgi:two-component system NtrC family sensor kinase
MSPLELVASAAHVLADAPPDERVVAVCAYLKAALPAADVRFRGGGRRSDSVVGVGDPATVDLVTVTVPSATRREASLEVAGSSRAAAEVRAILTAVAALLAAVLPADHSEESDELSRLHGLTIDSLPLGIYVVDRDYRVALWNRKRETGTQGLRRGDVIGHRVFDVLRRQPPELLKAEFDAVFATGAVRVSEQEVHAGPDVRTFRTSRLPMRLGGEVVSHVITIGEDVTETRAIQRAMHQSEKLAAVGQLAAGVMHEINNPLAIIGGCVAAVMSRLGDAPDPEITEYLTMVEAEISRCNTIIDGLLDFSRAGRAVGAVEPVALHEMLDRTLQLVQHHQRFRRLRVQREFTEPSPRLLGNADRLIQAVMAILLNAADSTGGRGTVVIRTRAADGCALIELEDDGPGIPSELLPRIFDPFVTTKGPARGTGLGLAICYGIIADHGGTITVDSAPGVRTTFRITLPLAEEAA